MNELENLLGKELYEAVQKKIGNKGLLIDNGMLIPKHRFDCINISLKEHKEKVFSLQEENKKLAEENTILKEKIERYAFQNDELEVYRELSRYKLKNLEAVRSLLKIEGLHGNELKGAIRRQMSRLKKTDAYLFCEEEQAFILVPYSSIHKAEKKQCITQ